ncbi:hypothetical protein AB0J86_06125 [Micromonospora sp. NPDC049559]|uniref:hypothetical protein n=1 Tax=Micromonospora sp. NPDC049559 TaxID=3155923 RepID=UPI003448D3BE
MAGEGPAGSGWRERWAEQENAARRRPYAERLEIWRRRDADLRRMWAAAAAFDGTTDPAVAPWLNLRPGEVITAELPGVRLVEAPRSPGELPPPDLTRFPFLLETTNPVILPPGVEPVANGTAVVTSQRVVFRGGDRDEREWAYERLVGVHHDPSAPFSLLGVADRGSVSGLLLTEEQAGVFRFELTLAVANASGQRAAFVALLEGLVAAHQGLEPVAPEFVSAQDAPLTALLPRGRVALVLGAVVVLLVGAGAVAVAGVTGGAPEAGSDAASPGLSRIDVVPLPEPSGSSAPPVTPSRSASPTTLAPSSPTPRPSGSRSASPTPRRSASASAKPADLCGAPPNPYGYNHCHGSMVQNPPADVCTYFGCVSNFFEGRGYMVRCGDGQYSLTGGRAGSCAGHGNPDRPVYR